DNFDAHVKGAELEASYEPLPGLRFKFAGGYEDARLAKGSHSVDLMDRTAGNPDWMVLRPFITQASNCILPVYVVAATLYSTNGSGISHDCGLAYSSHVDPVTVQTYQYGVDNGLYPVIIPGVGSGPSSFPTITYPGFDPSIAPNNGQGFDKDLSGKELPNAPHFTTSLSADYTRPISSEWAATLHSDFYWQADSWARVFNDDPYDHLRGYTNINIALILTSQDGWQVMGYLKNVFDTTAITGDCLNSDDSGLTTNVFLADPRLFGVRVTKNWD